MKIKHLLAWLAAGILASAAHAAGDTSATGTITTQNLSSSETCTANSCVEIDVTDKGTLSVQVSGTYTGALTLQRTNDRLSWTTLSASTTFTNGAGTQTATITSGTTGTFAISGAAGFRKIRLTGLAAMTGTATVTFFTAAPGGGGGGSSGGGGGAVTVSDGSDATQGTTTDAACATDNGNCTVVQLVKRTNQRLTQIDTDITATNAQLPAALGATTAAASLPVTLDTTVASTTANAATTRLAVSLDLATPVTGTAAAAAVLSNMPFAVGKGAKSVIVNLTANTATANFEFSTDGTAAYAVVSCWLKGNSGSSGMVTSSTSASTYICPVEGTHFQVRQSGAGGVTATVTPSVRDVMQTIGVNIGGGTAQVTGAAAVGASASGNPVPLAIEGRTSAPTVVTNGQVQRLWGTLSGVIPFKPYTIPELEWNYAAASGGISNTTTAVTFQASAGAGLRNYVTAVDLMCEALTNATEVAIRDGAGGTVLWRTKVGTGGLTAGRHIKFPNPLKGTAATLLEVLTITASGAGACYFNASGYSAP
jgi:hypothetical protein